MNFFLSKKIFFLLIIIFLIIVLFVFQDYLSLEFVKSNLTWLKNQNDSNPIIFKLLFVVFYSISVAFSLPVATLITVLSGYLFGLWLGTMISLFSAAIGGVIAIKMVQFFVAKSVQKKFQKQIDQIDHFLKKHSFTTLLSLRLSPLFPYFMTNFFLGFLKVSMREVFLTILVGKFPILFLLSYMGKELASLKTLKGLISFDMFLILFLLSLLPWFNKWLVNRIKLEA